MMSNDELEYYALIPRMKIPTLFANDDDDDDDGRDQAKNGLIHHNLN